MTNTTLRRTAFTTNRAQDYFSESELTQQKGYGRSMWPLVLLKELSDNALDACESSGVLPQITSSIEDDAFIVTDNGPGLPSKDHQASTRLHRTDLRQATLCGTDAGAVGQRPEVGIRRRLCRNRNGRIEIRTHGKLHRIEVWLDRLKQEPKTTYSIQDDRNVQIGTAGRVGWAGLASYRTSVKTLDLYNDAFHECVRALVSAFSALNPHASFTIVPDTVF